MFFTVKRPEWADDLFLTFGKDEKTGVSCFCNVLVFSNEKDGHDFLNYYCRLGKRC